MFYDKIIMVMRIMENLNPQSLYIVAVSFGPDSMALLDMLHQNKYRIIVCHVNYHKRPESNNEEYRLTQYCQERRIPLYVLQADEAPAHVNFQAWARDIRYRFFAQIYRKFSADGLLVAHHLDDDLETFLMQRKKILKYYGIMPQRKLYDMMVIRPLLKWRKKDLQKYCEDHGIPFATDSSNLKDDYERNRIRHHIIEKADDSKIQSLLQEKDTLNQKREQQFKQIQEALLDNKLIIRTFLTFGEEEQILCLHEFITQRIVDYSLSKYKAQLMIQAAKANKPNWKIVLVPPYYLVKAYDTFYVQRESEIKGYSYILEAPDVLDTPYFFLDFRGDTSNRNVFDYDYPLTIRSFEPGDVIIIGRARKTIRRLFLDWKMPLELRSKWPVIVNNQNKIIYVPRYRANYMNQSNDNFVVKSKLGI